MATRASTVWEPDALVEVVEAVVRRGWGSGPHAYGERAVRILLDVYERVLQRNPCLPAGTLVMEARGLAGPEQRARGVVLGGRDRPRDYRRGKRRRWPTASGLSLTTTEVRPFLKSRQVSPLSRDWPWPGRAGARWDGPASADGWDMRDPLQPLPKGPR